jgi:hypothetical protein
MTAGSPEVGQTDILSLLFSSSWQDGRARISDAKSLKLRRQFAACDRETAPGHERPARIE